MFWYILVEIWILIWGETLKIEAGKKNHLKFTFFSFRDKTLLWKDYFSALNKPLSYVYTKCFYSYKWVELSLI